MEYEEGKQVIPSIPDACKAFLRLRLPWRDFDFVALPSKASDLYVCLDALVGVNVMSRSVTEALNYSSVSIHIFGNCLLKENVV